MLDAGMLHVCAKQTNSMKKKNANQKRNTMFGLHRTVADHSSCKLHRFYKLCLKTDIDVESMWTNRRNSIYIVGCIASIRRKRSKQRENGKVNLYALVWAFGHSDSRVYGIRYSVRAVVCRRHSAHSVISNCAPLPAPNRSQHSYGGSINKIILFKRCKPKNKVHCLRGSLCRYGEMVPAMLGYRYLLTNQARCYAKCFKISEHIVAAQFAPHNIRDSTMYFLQYRRSVLCAWINRWGHRRRRRRRRRCHFPSIFPHVETLFLFLLKELLFVGLCVIYGKPI